MAIDLFMTVYTLALFTMIGALLYRGSLSQKLLLACIALVIAYQAHQYQNSRLLTAAKNGEVITATSLLRWGARINTTNDTGATPLMIAVAMDHTDMVRTLLEKGADVSRRSKELHTALHYATAHGTCEIITQLISFGADPNAQDNQGNTPLFYAIKYNNVDAVSCLLEKGANPSLENLEGQTPLSFAKMLGNSALVELLTKHQTQNLPTSP